MLLYNFLFDQKYFHHFIHIYMLRAVLPKHQRQEEFHCDIRKWMVNILSSWNLEYSKTIQIHQINQFCFYKYTKSTKCICKNNTNTLNHSNTPTVKIYPVRSQARSFSPTAHELTLCIITRPQGSATLTPPPALSLVVLHDTSPTKPVNILGESKSGVKSRPLPFGCY